ncbi:hypothetical protein [Acinetobacter guillouiae]|uniref:hypothetical protein n=1 Tax=Acinetobacter guillouiae TaxID=106649 RepID=UPI0026E45149|nr:hypothetical protein [Acinetobacter guillouiae]
MYPPIKNIFKFNQLFYLYCMILLAFLYTQPTHAQNLYSNCSETLTQQLIQKFNLNTQQNLDARYPVFQTCLTISKHQQIIAISNPVAMQSDFADYDLNLYLIDTASSKILNHYTYPKTISADASQFENLKFDINPYAKTPHTHVIGLALTYGHLGRIDYTIREIKLFKISNQQMQLVLDKFMTNYSAGERPSLCENNAQTETQILLNPLKQQNHGLADIQLTEKSERITLDEKNCKTHRIVKKQSHIMKFDGKKYRFKHLNFLDFGI